MVRDDGLITGGGFETRVGVHCGLAKGVDATGTAIAFVLPGVAIVAVVDE